MSNDLMKIAEDSVRGSFFLVSGAFTATVVSSVSAIVVARLLGPELYGQYALSIVISQMLFLFTGFGIGQGVVKFAAYLRAEGETGKAFQIVKYAWIARVTSGLAFFVLNFLFADFLAGAILGRPDLAFYVRIASLSIILEVIRCSSTSAFIGLDVTQYNALTIIVERISKSVVSIVLVLTGIGVAGAVLGHVSGWVVGSAMASFFLLRMILRRKANDSSDGWGFTSSLRKLTNYGLPLYGSQIVVGFVPVIQTLALVAFTTDVEIGNLKAATNFITLVAVVSVPITTALFPAFSKLNSKMNKKIKAFFKFANKYTTLVIVPIATVLMVLSNEVVQVVYGSTYVTAAYFLSIYCLVYFLVGFGYITLSSLFNGLGATGTTLKMSLIALVALVGLSPILTSTFGVPGLIFSLLSANIFSTSYGVHAARRKFEIEFDIKSLGKIYVVGLASALPLLLMLQISPLLSLLNVMVGGLLYLFIYVTLVPITRIIDTSEMEMASQIVKKISPLSPFMKPLIRYEKMLLNRLKSKRIHLRTPKIDRGSIALIAKTATVVSATIAIFSQDLAIILGDAIQSETNSHILVIPFIIAYLLYRKRRLLKVSMSLRETGSPKETRHLSTIIGALLSVTAIILYWYGSYTFTPLEYHMFTLPIFVAGLTLVLFNRQTLRQLAFPIAFFYFLIPPPSQLLSNIGATLSIISSEASNAIVNLLGVPSTLTSEYGNPTLTIIRPDGTQATFVVDIACSGIYSLIGFLIFAVFIAYIIRDRLWKKTAIFILGLPLIYLLNIIRITTILLIGYQYGEEIALEIFHLLGGWTLMFLGTILLLTFSDKILKTQMFAKRQEKCEKPNPKTYVSSSFCLTCGKVLGTTHPKLSKGDITKIVAITLSTFLIISVQAPVFALTQSPPMVTINTPSGQQFSTDILPEISAYNLSFYYRDTQFEARAKQDMSLIYLYYPKNQSDNPIWVTIEIASTLSSLHTWEKCLITWPITHGYQPEVTQIDLRDVQLLDNPPIIARHFVFQYKVTNQTQATLYWYETTRFIVNSTSQQKHAKISLIAYPDNLEDIDPLQDQLEAVATSIASYWQPIKTWSQMALLLSQNGDQLIAVTIALLAGIIVFWALHWRRERKDNLQTYNKLSKPNKQMIDAILETEKVSIPTPQNILITYQNAIKQPVDKDKVLRELSEMEKTGIVKSCVFNRDDEPILVWKTQIAFE